MTKKLLVLALTAIAVAGANPALAHCGGSHGKSYRAATTSKKPVGGQSCTAERRSGGFGTNRGDNRACRNRDRLFHRLAAAGDRRATSTARSWLFIPCQELEGTDRVQRTTGALRPPHYRRGAAEMCVSSSCASLPHCYSLLFQSNPPVRGLH